MELDQAPAALVAFKVVGFEFVPFVILAGKGFDDSDAAEVLLEGGG